MENIKGHIYTITNLLNNKMYVGQTTRINPEKRWEEHQYAINDPTHNYKPLYRAMKKNKIENFSFNVIETLFENNSYTLNEREQFYIKKFHTYINDPECCGYNLTIGGDGDPTITKEEKIDIINTYLKEKNINITAKKKNRCRDTVSAILDEYNIKKFSTKEIITDKLGVKVAVYDKNGLIAVFPSQAELGRHFKPQSPRNTINAYCDGEGKFRYFRGYRLESTSLEPFNNEIILIEGDLIQSKVDIINPETNEIIQQFKNFTQAGIYVGLSPASANAHSGNEIRKAIKNKTSWKGYYWRINK